MKQRLNQSLGEKSNNTHSEQLCAMANVDMAGEVVKHTQKKKEMLGPGKPISMSSQASARPFGLRVGNRVTLVY